MEKETFEQDSGSWEEPPRGDLRGLPAEQGEASRTAWAWVTWGLVGLPGLGDFLRVLYEQGTPGARLLPCQLWCLRSHRMDWESGLHVGWTWEEQGRRQGRGRGTGKAVLLTWGRHGVGRQVPGGSTHWAGLRRRVIAALLTRHVTCVLVS